MKPSLRCCGVVVCPASYITFDLLLLHSTPFHDILPYCALLHYMNLLFMALISLTSYLICYSWHKFPLQHSLILWILSTFGGKQVFRHMQVCCRQMPLLSQVSVTMSPLYQVMYDIRYFNR